MTGIEHAVDAGVRNATGNSLVLFNSVFVFVGVIVLWIGFLYADSIALWDIIAEVTRRESSDGQSGFVVVVGYCILMYLAKVVLIRLYSLPYAHHWLTPLYSQVVMLVAPLTGYLIVDFGFARGRGTRNFFKSIKSALYRAKELTLKLLLTPLRVVLEFRFPGNYLHVNAAESEHYELTRISCGKHYYHIYYDPLLNNYLVQKTSHYDSCVELVKINSLGVIIGRIVNLPALSGSGLCFGDGKYYDWAITGNATAQSYIAILELNQLTEAQCIALLQECERLEVHEGSKYTATRYYLKMPTGWLVLEKRPADENKTSDEVREITFSLEALAKEYYTTKCIQRMFALVYPAAQERSIYQLDTRIQLLSFAKQSYVSKTYQEINWLYWYGGYGVGSLQLRHENEHICFKAFVCQNDAGYCTDFAFYAVPPGVAVNTTVLFLRCDRDRVGRRSNDQPGLYIVRPKTPLSQPVVAEHEMNGIVFGEALRYARQYPWQPVVKLDPNRGAIQHIQYCNGGSERVNVAFTHHRTPVQRALPAEIALHWNRNVSKRDFLQMYFNGKMFHWSANAHLIFSIDAVVHFDAEEVAEVFAALAMNDTPLQLQIFMEEWFEEKYNNDRKFLTVQVSNGVDVIPLRRTVLSVSDLYKDTDNNRDNKYYPDRDNYGPVNSFEEAWLKRVYEKALDDVGAAPVFLEAAAFLIHYKTWPGKDNFKLKLSFYYMKLLFGYTIQKEYVSAQAILAQYIENWIPIAGLDKYSTFIASEGLALALLCKNDRICEPVFDKILGRDFDIMRLDTMDLLYNLGCFYATHHNKDKMLVAVRQALRHGKEPEQFTTDPDFSDYWRDADFLETLKEPRKL
ncbi:MAG: hypothetical protein HY080_01650 [Gammaproteobacteria bacterium]|nr:hypothetical protein [Gammaproteobacteria bacterium]